MAAAMLCPRGPRSVPPASRGPLLSSTPYAPYAFRVYPGPEDAATKAALAGFNVVVDRMGTRVHLSISVVGGSSPAQSFTYPASDRVYFIEASLGDDSGNADYSFGDDGLVVTDPAGRIVQ
jgi:hypothetical protein